MRHGPNDLVDPASVIAQNKQLLDRGGDRNRPATRDDKDLRKAKTVARAPEPVDPEEAEEDLIQREMMKAAVNEIDFE